MSTMSIKILSIGDNAHGNLLTQANVGDTYVAQYQEDERAICLFIDNDNNGYSDWYLTGDLEFDCCTWVIV